MFRETFFQEFAKILKLDKIIIKWKNCLIYKLGLEVKMNSFSKKNLKFGQLISESYTITFPTYVSSNYFEPLLKECYKKSKRVKEVIFDFSDVIFFDTFEVGLIATWILELKNAGIHVKVRFPFKKIPGTDKENSAFAFLSKYGFEKFLRSNLTESDIIYNENIVSKKESEVSSFYPDLQKSGFTPLIFASEDEFKEYFLQKKLQNLDYDLKDYEYVNLLRDTIIYELRENIQKYANDTNPYIIMDVFRRSKTTTLEKEYKDEKFSPVFIRLQYGPEWEKSFFETLSSPRYPGNLNFLELVIGDGGPGIPATLGKIVECREMSEVQIVDHAFEFGSTSDPKGRLRAFMQCFSPQEVEEYYKFPPPTGLYQVKKLLKKLGGFLIVRSGKALVSYDFLTYPDLGRPEGKLTPEQTSVDFKGTHYKIYLPLPPPSYFGRKESFFGRLRIYPSQIEYVLDKISLKEYFSEKKDLASQGESLAKVLPKMSGKLFSLKSRTISKGESSIRGILLMDFEGINKENLLTKVLHYLTLNMMWMQDPPIAIIGINVGNDLLSEMEDVTSEAERRKASSLIVYDEKFGFHFIETRDGEKELIEKLRKNPLSNLDLSKDERTLIESNTHLVELLEGKYYLINPEQEILRYVADNLKKEVGNFILDGSNGVFNPNVKVLIPKHYYAEGYFELGKLIRNKEILRKIKKWLFYKLILLDNPSVLITTNKNLEEIIDESITEKTKWIKISDPFIALPYSELANINKEDRICMFCGVIGSGESVMKILELIKNKNIVKIFSIVDARSEETKAGISPKNFNYNNHSYDLESIICKPLKFYKDKPHDWDYSSIRKVDSQTYSILLEPLILPEEPIWIKDEKETFEIEGDKQEKFSNDFIEKISEAKDSLSIGHFITNRNKHIVYRFEISNILDKFREEIADCIIKDLNTSKEKNESLKISHILYPETDSKSSLEQLANRISNSLEKDKPECKSISLDAVYDTSSLRDIGIKNVSSVVLLIDFMATGFTLQSLINIIAQDKANSIFIYVLTNRADNFSTKFFSSLSSYRGKSGSSEITIKYLVNFPIPAFDSDSCPICKYLNKLKGLKRLFNDLNFENEYCLGFLDKEIEKLRRGESNFPSLNPENIKNILCLRWLLEVAKTKIGAAKQLKNEIQEDQRAVDFLAILYNEFLYFFDNQNKDFDKILYFTDSLKSACNALCNDKKILEGNTGPIILVWYYLDSEYFYTNIENHLSKLLKDGQEDLFWKVVTFILIGEHLKEDKTINKLAYIINNLLSSQGLSLKLNFLLGKTRDYLQSRVKILIRPPLYFFYLVAREGVYDIDNNYRKIKESQAIIDVIPIIENSINFYQNESLKGVKDILDSGLLASGAESAIKEVTGEIDSDIKYLTKLLEPIIYKLITFNDYNQEYKNRIQAFYEHLMHLREVMDKIFKCNLTETIDSVIKEKEKDIFSKFNIKVEKSYLGEKWFAFIKWEDIVFVLGEIFNNLEHAFHGREKEDNKVKILIEETWQESNFNVVQLQILNNGKLNERRIDREGHRRIYDYVGKYGGRFIPLQEINPLENIAQEGYKVKTTISLIKLELK